MAGTHGMPLPPSRIQMQFSIVWGERGGSCEHVCTDIHIEHIVLVQKKDDKEQGGKHTRKLAFPYVLGIIMGGNRNAYEVGY